MLYPQQWMAYSHEERLILHEKLGLKKSEGTFVENNKLISDGHTIQDLMGVTVEKLQELTGSKSGDMVVLIQQLLYPVNVEEEHIKKSTKK